MRRHDLIETGVAVEIRGAGFAGCGGRGATRQAIIGVNVSRWRHGRHPRIGGCAVVEWVVVLVVRAIRRSGSGRRWRTVEEGVNFVVLHPTLRGSMRRANRWQTLERILVELLCLDERRHFRMREVMHQARELIVRQAEVETDESLLHRPGLHSIVDTFEDIATCLDALSVLLLQEQRLDVVQLQRVRGRYRAVYFCHGLRVECATTQALLTAS